MDIGWRSKKERKLKNKFKGQTPGKQKGETCQASTMDRHMAKCSRSYKHRDYRSWLIKVRKYNKEDNR